jgi:hypothetical protein
LKVVTDDHEIQKHKIRTEVVRRNLIIPFVVTSLLLLFGINKALAGAKIKISDDADIDLGFRLQTYFFHTDENIDGNPGFETENSFTIKRARFRLGANVTKWVSLFLQTELGGSETNSVKMIDAFIRLKPHEKRNIIAGQNVAPASRGNLTSSGGMLTIERPGIINKVLTWGTRANKQFSNGTLEGTSAGLGSTAGSTNRDLGVTLFGHTSIPENNSHIKYYLGVYDGSDKQFLTGEDSERIAGRIQLNFIEPESGYFNIGTYLGKKKTIGIGASFDYQENVTISTDEISTVTGNVDYSFYTFDIFLELPLGDGAITVEGAYKKLDLDSATGLPQKTSGGNVDFTGNPDDFVDARQVQGDGYYFQLGYYKGKWQPWFGYETWDSDAGNIGSFDQYRLGLSYFLKDHNANFKIGYEKIDADYPLSGSDDEVDTILVGIFISY